MTPMPPKRPSPNKNSLRDVNSMIKDQRGRNMAARDAVKSTRAGIKTQREDLQNPGMTKGMRQEVRSSIAGDRARVQGSLRPMLQEGRQSMQVLKDKRTQLRDQKAASIASAIQDGKPKPGYMNGGMVEPGYKNGGMVKTGRAQTSGMKFQGTF